MPTGYTAYIEDGTIKTGKEFLKLCIREFGCCIGQRDDPLSAPLKIDIEQDSYYRKRQKEVEAEIARLNGMTETDVLRDYASFITDRIKACNDMLARKRKELVMYDKIEKEVNDWIPPTPDHDGIKDFALEQIRISKPSSGDFMCYERELSHFESMDRTPEAARKWYAEKIEYEMKDLERTMKNIEDDEARRKSRENFLKNFVRSLDIIDEKKEA